MDNAVHSKRRLSLGNLMEKFRQKHKGASDLTSVDALLVVPTNDHLIAANCNAVNKDLDFLKTDAAFNRRKRCDSEKTSDLQRYGYGDLADLRAVRTSPMKSQPPSTPMGDLLSSSLSSAQASSHFGSNKVGPEEFLQMFNRNRAYSDCNDAKQAALNAARTRKLNSSNTASTPVSPLAMSGFTRSAPITPSGDSPRLTRLTPSSFTPVLPLTIPEHKTASHGSSLLSQQLIPPTAGERRRRMSVFTSPTSPLHSDRLTNQRMGRRSSAPTGPNFLKPARLDADLSQRNLDEAMINFPKFPVVSRGLSNLSPPSPLGKTGHVILWRAKGQDDKLFFIPENPANQDALELDGHDRLLSSRLLKLNRCYDVMPPTSCVVTLSAELRVIDALDALILHGIRAAPLWDSREMEFIGMLTITDFIKILLLFHNAKTVIIVFAWCVGCVIQNRIDQVIDHKISVWRDLLEDGHRPLINIDSDASLYDAVFILRDHRIHRLLVMDSRQNTPLFILTYKLILKFIFQILRRIQLPAGSFYNKSIAELEIGTYQNIAVVRKSTSLTDALTLLVQRRVSALPIIDEDNHIYGVYSKAHAMSVGADETCTSLDMTVEDALHLEHDSFSFEGVYGCSKSDTLISVICKIQKVMFDIMWNIYNTPSRMIRQRFAYFVGRQVHRLLIIDERRHLEGIVTLSDIVHFLVFQCGDELAESDLDDVEMSIMSD